MYSVICLTFTMFWPFRTTFLSVDISLHLSGIKKLFQYMMNSLLKVLPRLLNNKCALWTWVFRILLFAVSRINIVNHITVKFLEHISMFGILNFTLSEILYILRKLQKHIYLYLLQLTSLHISMQVAFRKHEWGFFETKLEASSHNMWDVIRLTNQTPNRSLTSY